MKLAMTLALVLAPLWSFGMDRLSALSMLESADNDRAVGKAGEISRYQILKSEWRSVSATRSYTNPTAAKQVAEVLIQRRLEQFQTARRRAPTDYEFYVLWNAPAQALNGRISPKVAERARRFVNLCSWDNVMLASITSPRSGSPVPAPGN